MIELKNIYIEDNNKKNLFKNISLSITDGSLISIEGNSGSGKSLFIKMLALIKKPQKGKVSVFRRNIENLSRNEITFIQRRIGVVFQDSNLVGHLSVKDNIILPLIIANENKKDIENAVKELMKWLGISSIVEESINNISWTNIKLINLARAIINRPRIILLDDFFSGIDAEVQEKTMHLLLALNKIGATIVITGRTPDILYRSKYRHYLIKDGIIINKLNNKYL